MQGCRSDSRKRLMQVGLLAVALLGGCASGPTDAIIGVENPSKPAAAVPDITSHEIFVMTTRQRTSEPAIMYSGERAPGLGLARVTVTVPPMHQLGMTERPREVPPDPEKHFTVIDPVTYSGDAAFLADLDRALRARTPKDRSILAFVHGFNTTYADAVLRMGQFVEDTGFGGVPVLFTWASAGKSYDYVYDLNSALSARNDLIAANDLLAQSSAPAVNLVAHSMGNFLTVEAMKQVQIEGRFNRSGKLKNLILASADIDIDVFKDQMAVFDPNDRRFYVLISADDKALSTSRFLARGISRVGDADAEQLAALGVTVIDMTGVTDPNDRNHSKFAESPEVVQLIGGSILAGDSLDASSGGPGPVGAALQGLANTAGSVVGGGRVLVVPGG